MVKSETGKYVVLSTLLMLSALFYPLTPILGAGTGEGPGPLSPPEPPGDAHRVNMSEAVPHGFVYSARNFDNYRNNDFFFFSYKCAISTRSHGYRRS